MSKAAKWVISFVIFFGACGASAALAFGNYYYYNWISGYFVVKDAFLSALLFSAFLLVIGVLVLFRRPRFYGFQIGESFKMWKPILLVSAAVCAFTAICLFLTPRTPYSGANWAVEMILVPISEEMIWRGIIFSLVYKVLTRLHDDKMSIVLTIAFSSIAFGLAHISNVLVHPVSFVLLQIIFAAIAGSGMGFLRAITKSVYPPILVHALFNLVAIMF